MQNFLFTCKQKPWLRFWFIIPLLALFSCGSEHQEKISLQDEKGVFATNLRGICNAVENYNDMLGKNPDTAAWGGYADLLATHVDRLKSSIEEEAGITANLNEELEKFNTMLPDLRNSDEKTRLGVQKKLYTMTRQWLKEFKL